MLISFQCRPLIEQCFLATASVRTTIKMADCEEIQAGHAQRKRKRRERNWKDEKIEMLIMLYEEKPCHRDVCHKDYTNRDSKTNMITAGRIRRASAADAILKRRTPCLHLDALCGALGTSKCEHPRPDFLRRQFIHRSTRVSFVFPNNVFSFSHWDSRTFSLFPENLATRETQQETLFPQQCFLV